MTDAPTGAPARPRSRRRGVVLESAILAAAVAELTESGFPGLTIDRVAARAGTNKNAIYRRWPDRLALGVAAYARMARETPLPDTGDLRGDALELLRRANRHWSSSLGAILRDLFAAGGGSQMLSRMPEQSTDALARAWLTVLGRAVARGQAPPSALHPRVATVAIVLLRNEFVVRGLPTAPDEVLVEIVDQVYLPLIRGYQSTIP